MEETNKASHNSILTPVAILAAGVMISGSILYSGGVSVAPKDLKAQVAPDAQAAPPVAKDEYIRGNPSAPITIVEYSDLECPFCKRFHSTVQQALDEYGDQVRWVYKHFPLDQIHSKADKEAEAAECAGELGGSEKFWAYIDRVFEVTPSNNGLDLALLPQIAREVGLHGASFEACITSGKYAEKVERQYQEGLRFGVSGTPGSFVNNTFVGGAVPYANLKAIIEAELAEL